MILLDDQRLVCQRGLSRLQIKTVVGTIGLKSFDPPSFSQNIYYGIFDGSMNQIAFKSKTAIFKKRPDDSLMQNSPGATVKMPS